MMHALSTLLFILGGLSAAVAAIAIAAGVGRPRPTPALPSWGDLVEAGHLVGTELTVLRVEDGSGQAQLRTSLGPRTLQWWGAVGEELAQRQVAEAIGAAVRHRCGGLPS